MKDYREANASKVVEMLELLAIRTGEDRATVFLDVIIQLIFSKDSQTLSGMSGLRQQQILNEIAAVYGILAPILKHDESVDPNEIPF